MKPQISIIIANYNTKNLLKKCLESIYANTKKIHFEVTVVDNNSQDGSLYMLETLFPKIVIIKNKTNVYLTKAINQGLKKAAGKYFLVLNSDIELPGRVLVKMRGFLDNNPNIGLASCRQIDKKGQMDTTCSTFPTPILEFFESNILGKYLQKKLQSENIDKLLSSYRYKQWKRDTVRNVDVIPASFMIGRQSLLKKIGLFDEKFLLFYEEPDYCKRVRAAGYDVCHNGKVTVTHLKAKSVEQLPHRERAWLIEHDMLAYYKKNFGFLWWLILWIVYRPNWFWWHFLSHEV